MTKSSLSFKTLPPEFSSRLLSATNHKSTQVEAQMLKRPTEILGDLQIRSIWKHQTDCILADCILDAPSNTGSSPSFPWAWSYRHACQDQRRPFSPFVVSCDRVLGSEAKVQYVVLQNLAGSLAKKSHKSNSETTNVINLCSASEDHASPLWAEWANIPIVGKMEPAWACCTIRRTPNVSQN